MEQKKLIDVANATSIMCGELRYGQSLMVGLQTHEPEIYQQITGTDADPFYDDEKLPAFWAKYQELAHANPV